jgi:hypothetical protein
VIFLWVQVFFIIFSENKYLKILLYIYFYCKLRKKLNILTKIFECIVLWSIFVYRSHNLLSPPILKPLLKLNFYCNISWYFPIAILISQSFCLFFLIPEISDPSLVYFYISIWLLLHWQIRAPYHFLPRAVTLSRRFWNLFPQILSNFFLFLKFFSIHLYLNRSVSLFYRQRELPKLVIFTKKLYFRIELNFIHLTLLFLAQAYF